MVLSGWWHRVGSCCFAIAGFGIWFWARARSSNCLVAEVHLNGVVWLVASCWQLLFCDCWVWALVLGSCSVVKLLGGRGAFGLVSSELVGGT